MLVAPAGYGKTTLAEQWVARGGRSAAWYRARLSSTDVAALALGIARSASSIVDEADARLLAHLRALPAPAENVETLAEILGEDLAAWPDTAWLVLDDYHEVAQEPRAEDFVKTLVAVSPIQILIASRVRPAWVTRKELMYGDAFEINQSALAMDAEEAADVLVERSRRSASGLMTLAHGWPAVIGLASASSAEIAAGSDQVPESLYRFFADEVFSALGAEVRQGLTTLAIAPVLDHELASRLLGADAAETVCAAALDVGLLVERAQQLDLHPLARAFLEERSTQLGLTPDEGAAAACLDMYRSRREWDAAFELIVKTRAGHELEDLMRRALDDLLETARLSTLERWCNLAADVDVVSPIFALARAELSLRHGRHVEAVSHAEAAAEQEPALAFRAHMLAGRAAHLASREEHALDLFEHAEAAAGTEGEMRDAQWGQLMCLTDLELPTAAIRLAELSEGVGFGDPRGMIQAAANRLNFQLRLGSIDLEDADVASQVLPAVSDPLVVSSFLSGYSIALSLVARYDDAFAAARELRNTAERYRLDFALSYADCAEAMAHCGRREWSPAERAARKALARARAGRDTHADLLSCSILLRAFAQQARLADALALRIGAVRGALKASVGEVVCSRALVLACAGRSAEALEIVDEVRGTTSAVEVLVLVPAVEAVAAVRAGARDVIERANTLAQTAFATGAVDMLVTTYRACPELLSILLRSTDSRRFRELVALVGDGDLAVAVGQPIAFEDRRVLLSPREKDVYELLCTGRTNKQIASLLVIEESTAKAHTHRIYDKLGVRSRAALTVQALLERADQATSAIESSEEDSDSSAR